ncbi:hypothetical protein ScPMuIL_005043 [Solemya velum]
MEDITVLKADIDKKLDKENTNLSLLKESLARSNTNTQNMLGILSSFENRLKKLESTITPVYNETENLRRRQENIERTSSMLENVLGYYHVAKEVEMDIKEGPSTCGLQKYLSTMDRLLKALNYFHKHNVTSLELSDVSQLFNEGKDVLQTELRNLLGRHGRPVPPVLILDLIGPDEELQPGDDIALEHLPAKVMTELSDISKWLVTCAGSADFLKDYWNRRSSMLVASLNGLKEHLKSASGGSATLSIQHSPALPGKLRAAKDTPNRRSMNKFVFLTKKAQTALMKSPFEPGHRRQGSSTPESSRDEGADIEIDIYITEMSAVLKLMQSESQLMMRILPDKHHRTVFDNIVQQALDMVIGEGELIATNARKCIGRHDFSAVLSIFPVVKHLRTIKPVFDLTLEGCQPPTRAKLGALLSKLGSTGAKALEEYIEFIKNDPDKASHMPQDGTVHELTNHTIIFLENLHEYPETVGAMLLMHGKYGSKKSKMKAADYITKVLSALGRNLSNKAETYSDVTLRPVFMLNNYNYMLTSLRRAGLLVLIHMWNKDVEKYYTDHIVEQKRLYSQSWSKVLHYILEVNEPMSYQRTQSPDLKLKDKTRQNIKDKFTGFNKELEEIERIQKGYAMPDTELRESIKKDNKEYILPKYHMFLEKYRKLNFTKNPDKYIKHTVESVERVIERFFDTSA